MRTLVVLSWLASGAAASACGTELLSCEIGSKRLSLCLTDRSVTYTFGPEAEPELALERDVLDVDYVPWAGVGRTLYESVRLENGGYVYEVWHGIDRLDLDAVLEGGVTVSRGEESIAALRCDAGSAEGNIYPLFEAIEAAGRCFSLETRVWGACGE